jgi:hypothetical protein
MIEELIEGRPGLRPIEPRRPDDFGGGAASPGPQEAGEGFNYAYSIVRGLAQWNRTYDPVVDRLFALWDDETTPAIADKLIAWEDKSVPRLIELRETHLVELGPEAADLYDIGTPYRLVGVDSTESRQALLAEIAEMMYDLTSISDLLDLVDWGCYRAPDEPEEPYQGGEPNPGRDPDNLDQGDLTYVIDHVYDLRRVDHRVDDFRPNQDPGQIHAIDQLGDASDSALERSLSPEKCLWPDDEGPVESPRPGGGPNPPAELFRRFIQSRAPRWTVRSGLEGRVLTLSLSLGIISINESGRG